MDPQYIPLWMFLVLLFGIFSGFPLAYVLLGSGFLFGYLGWGTAVFDQMVARTLGIMMNDALVAVSLFIFMGYLMDRSRIAEGLFHTLQLALGPLRGSLAIVTVLLCTILAATTGIVGTSVTMMGLLALPVMLKRGYDVPLATGSIIAGGTLGILIPPSVMLILYGPMAGLSIARLFTAAILPGLLLSGLYLAYIAAQCFFRPQMGQALPKEERDIPWSRLFVLLLKTLFPPLFLILAVLGSILFGLAAPTEAAAVGVVGAGALCLAYGRMNWETLKDVVYRTLQTSAMILVITVGANIFTGVFLALGGGTSIENALLKTVLTPYSFLAVVMVLILFLGMFVDWIAIILIMIPIISPIVKKIGFDPIWFAILVCVNLQVSYLSPPFAYSIFYLKGVAPPEVELKQIYKGVVPFMILQLAGLILCILFPDIVLWLPGLVYG
ncbi:MAG: TRAP transporter large permease subunit [Syntrophaceae bacterium]|nr:TRAP transporter large permease subunit [Syntrophaceae bacterium]